MCQRHCHQLNADTVRFTNKPLPSFSHWRSFTSFSMQVSLFWLQTTSLSSTFLVPTRRHQFWQQIVRPGGLLLSANMTIALNTDNRLNMAMRMPSVAYLQDQTQRLTKGKEMRTWTQFTQSESLALWSRSGGQRKLQRCSYLDGHKTLQRRLTTMPSSKWKRGGGGTYSVHSFRQVQDSLSCEAGCLFYGARLVIPTSLQHQVLHILHQGHFGMKRMKQLARTAVYWPGIDLCRTCPTCEEHQGNPPKAPVHPWMLPEKPRSRVNIDHAVNFTTGWYSMTPIRNIQSFIKPHQHRAKLPFKY